MYATISKKTGVIRRFAFDRVVCESEKTLQWELFHDSCIVVEVPQLMLDDFGHTLLDFYKEEVSAE